MGQGMSCKNFKSTQGSQKGLSRKGFALSHSCAFHRGKLAIIPKEAVSAKSQNQQEHQMPASSLACQCSLVKCHESLHASTGVTAARPPTCLDWTYLSMPTTAWSVRFQKHERIKKPKLDFHLEFDLLVTFYSLFFHFTHHSQLLSY